MIQSKTFFISLENLLRSRFPADEFEQIQDDARWEFESLGRLDRLGKTAPDWVRTCAIGACFYKAMTKMGIDSEAAAKSISEAATETDWIPVPVWNSLGASCPLADFFSGQKAFPVCEALFCQRCPRAKECATRAAEASRSL